MPPAPKVQPDVILNTMKGLNIFGDDGKLKKETNEVWKTAIDLFKGQDLTRHNLYMKFQRNEHSMTDRHRSSLYEEDINQNINQDINQVHEQVNSEMIYVVKTIITINHQKFMKT